MDYQDKLHAGTVFDEAIKKVLNEYGVSDQYGIYGPDLAKLVSSISQAVLNTFHQVNLMTEQEALKRLYNLAMRAPNPTEEEMEAIRLLVKSIKENEIMDERARDRKS